MASETSGPKKLVFFIVDGFSDYYLREYQSHLNGINELLDNGSRAEHVTPVFPTLSLPNYYSMFTGLTVEKHGIISNIMYDAEWQEMFDVELDDRDRWYAGAPEPLWIRAPKEGVRTYLYWPWFVNFKAPSSCGENLEYFEELSEFYKNHSSPSFSEWIEEKLNQIICQLQQPYSQFFVVYWPTLDNWAHTYGPRAPKTLEEIKLVDGVLKKFQDKLTEASLWNSVNLVVVSDHGQSSVPPENRVFLDDFCPNLENIKVACELEPLKHIYPVEGKTEEVYQMLKNANMPNIDVYLNEDLPDSFQFKHAKRCAPILLLAHPGYAICIKSLVNPFLDSGHYHMGLHGYDNRFPEMRAVLMVRGPLFRKRHVGSAVRTIDFYSVMCRTLGLNLTTDDTEAYKNAVSSLFA